MILLSASEVNAVDNNGIEEFPNKGGGDGNLPRNVLACKKLLKSGRKPM